MYMYMHFYYNAWEIISVVPTHTLVYILKYIHTYIIMHEWLFLEIVTTSGLVHRRRVIII